MFLYVSNNVFVSNNEKTFICASEYENFLVRNLKKRDKLTQSVTPGQHTKNRDCPGKTRTVGMFEVNHHVNHHDWPMKN